MCLSQAIPAPKYPRDITIINTFEELLPHCRQPRQQRPTLTCATGAVNTVAHSGGEPSELTNVLREHHEPARGPKRERPLTQPSAGSGEDPAGPVRACWLSVLG